MGNVVRNTYGLKTTLKLLVHVLAIMASSYLKIVFLQKSGLNPPPPLKKCNFNKAKSVMNISLNVRKLP